MQAKADLTALLQAWSEGQEAALQQLAPIVQCELREMARRLVARETAGGLQPTELVQECYLRLLEWRAVRWQNRAHFFTTTARMMRRVLVDEARARRSAKRGGDSAPVPVDAESVAMPETPIDVVAVAEAIEDLGAISPRASQVVELRFFGGFSVEETAEALGVSARTVVNDWNSARAWLRNHLSTGGGHESR
jgi:RNA polymerase sigma factor (TIGR02999 family)